MGNTIWYRIVETKKNKMTAVEWLISVLAHNDILDHKALSNNERLYNLYKRLVEKGKQMEAEQKIDAVISYAKAHGFIGLVEELQQLKK